jgi:drug/metabolite transporter (DMT)-like permease
MNWLIFVCGAVLAWGMYGVTLHRGQAQLASPLRALLCVGFAYFLIAVLVPSVAMWSKGEFAGFTTGGTVTAILAGCLGAAGAICIIWAFKSGGKPLYVMPLVFGGAPLVNVLGSVLLHPPKTAPNPLLYLGFVLVALGAAMVLYFRPTS